MLLFWRFLLVILKVMNYWFFVIPNRLSIIAFMCYYLLIDWSIGDQPIYLFNRELGGVNSWGYFFFWLGLGFPFFWSFVSLFSVGQNNGTGVRINSAIDDTLKFRNGQMSVSSPQKAFEILKETSNLDVMSANQESGIYKSAYEGFNALYAAKPPQEVYKGLMDKKEK